MSGTVGNGPGRKDASKLGGRRLGWLIATGTLRAGGIFGPSPAFVLSFSKSFSTDSGTFKNIVLLTIVRIHRVIVVCLLILSTHVFSRPLDVGAMHWCRPSQYLSVNIFKISKLPRAENDVWQTTLFIYMYNINVCIGGVARGRAEEAVALPPPKF